MRIDELGKSRTLQLRRHSGLSGILLFQRIMRQYDSPGFEHAGACLEAGMKTFYETINHAIIRIRRTTK
jgi:hypothetical protein